MRELVFLCPGTVAEAFSDALLDAGALSVSVEDADHDTEAEQPLFGEPGSEPELQAWVRNQLVVLLADGMDPEQLLEVAQAETGYAIAYTTGMLREVPDADWVRLTQSQFGPIRVGERILIVPSWHANDGGCLLDWRFRRRHGPFRPFFRPEKIINFFRVDRQQRSSGVGRRGSQRGEADAGLGRRQPARRTRLPAAET